MNHDAMLDTVAVLALGALPEFEANEAAAHVRDCAKCRAEYAELRPVADGVGYAAAPAAAVDQVSAARRKTRIMRAVRADSAAMPPTPSEARIAPSRSGSPARSRPALVPYGLAAAAIAVAAYLGVSDASLRGERDTARSDVAHLRASDAALRQTYDARAAELAEAQGRADSLADRYAILTDARTRRFVVPQGEVITAHGRVFYALRLPVLAQGKVYQAWTLAKGAKAVAPSVTFEPGRDGVAFVELPVKARDLAAVALSIEPAGGSKTPTTKPKFVRPLS